MNRLKAWIRSFFAFSRSETNAFLILLPLLVVIIFLEPAYRYWFVRQKQDFSNEQKKLDSLVATWKWEEKSDSTLARQQLFTFDPNKNSKEELEKLGFIKSIANRIVSYRSKGGKFLIKSDLLKIYGMDSTLYRQLYAYINLPIEKPNKEFAKSEKPESLKKKPKVKLDLNLADTAQLLKVYGVGEKLSVRIVKYRDKLGGFNSLNQLNEVFGLDSIVIKEIVRDFFIGDNFLPTQIKLNSASENELASHPYIGRFLARVIAAYRFQHGKFSEIEDLRKVQKVTEKTFEKLKPYLTLE